MSVSSYWFVIEPLVYKYTCLCLNYIKNPSSPSIWELADGNFPPKFRYMTFCLLGGDPKMSNRHTKSLQSVKWICMQVAVPAEGDIFIPGYHENNHMKVFKHTLLTHLNTY